MAVFGSSDREVDTSVASVCSALHIPYLTTGTSFALDDNSGKYTVQMGPQATHLVQAVHSLVVTLGWKDIAFIVHRKTGEWVSCSRTRKKPCHDHLNIEILTRSRRNLKATGVIKGDAVMGRLWHNFSIVLAGLILSHKKLATQHNLMWKCSGLFSYLTSHFLRISIKNRNWAEIAEWR